VYDAAGKNFFNTMRRLMSERTEIAVVDDQVGAPTYAPHLAAASLRALEAALRMEVFPSGVYHLCHGGQVSWHGFAQAILEGESQFDEPVCQVVKPISSAAYKTAAVRPLNSRLDCSKIKRVLDVWLPPWQVGLDECFELAGGFGGH
jgi:dTDP-4-dehydrorhamnose reductase